LKNIDMRWHVMPAQGNAAGAQQVPPS